MISNLDKVTKEDRETLIDLFYVRKFFRNKDINCILNKSNNFEFSYKDVNGIKETFVFSLMGLIIGLKLGLQKIPDDDNNIEFIETEDININCSLSEEDFFTFSYENSYGNKITLGIDLINLANYLVSGATKAILIISAKYNIRNFMELENALNPDLLESTKAILKMASIEKDGDIDNLVKGLFKLQNLMKSYSLNLSHKENSIRMYKIKYHREYGSRTLYKTDLLKIISDKFPIELEIFFENTNYKGNVDMYVHYVFKGFGDVPKVCCYIFNFLVEEIKNVKKEYLESLNIHSSNMNRYQKDKKISFFLIDLMDKLNDSLQDFNSTKI